MVSHSRRGLHHLRDLVNEDQQGFATNVYARLFSIEPALRDLFGPSMTEMRSKFVGVIDHVLATIPAPSGQDELVDFLAQLGRDHRKYGITPEHYNHMYQALMDEFAAMMGADWDTETQQAVSQAMLLTTGVMRGAAQMAEGPAVWTAEVAEKFRISRDLAVVRLLTDHPPVYQTGQYLEVCIPQWPKTWRNLSPAIPPNEAGELEFHVRGVPGGLFSASVVKETAVGDRWTFAQAHGTLHIEPQLPVLMVAGGTGLAPLRALLLDMARRADQVPTHIFYGTRYPGELYDLAVLRRICATNPWLTVTAVSEHTEDPWWLDAVVTPTELGIEHMYGTLANVVVTYSDWSEHQVLLAGSPDMIESTRTRLIITGVPARRIQHDPLT
ncbi:oxidoreductase [Gordonia pseudamarae]|uniref:nitric oxide dioxygenase n=1 Tax=Gordonia pseudamarae TaxID=2831662 RepID=A0ABX6IN65_9ACTN|nr:MULTISPECIES: FAD-binding oxidoreductase [Gordonia]MBD0020829.1 oxidoreductase [Gordonia sp. (in: high G+C Gram-positive bacteria)]QHN27858.1 oxidoreductase [Gordonia pseudamarae]QHN36741.1 oxidoreductase [Gordonia pseudamarae]